MVHSSNQPILAIQVLAEKPGYYSAYFERPRGFTFDPGDWMEINHPSGQLVGGTVYSISSSPHEPELRITFREGASPFKKILRHLRPGDRLLMKQYGNDYGFRHSEHKPSIFIAGGVGVAPFRSMVKDMVETDNKNQVKLIYLDTNGNFLFKEELDAWQRQLTHFEVQYIATKELKRKDRMMLLKSLVADVNQQFYVSGPSGMVASTVGLLEDVGVAGQSIKVDDFGHY